MTTCKRVLALGGVMLLSAASVVQADTTQGSDVQAELSAMRSRIAQLEGQQNQSWLNERRAEEVKSLVREVLSDADTRASMAEGSLNATVDANGTHINSEDGTFSLNIAGQIQFRYTYNAREGGQAPGEDKNGGSFSTPRVKLFFDGHIADPRIGYHLVIKATEGGGDVVLEEYAISYEVADGFTVWGGLVTDPVVRGDMIDSRYMLAADRSNFSNFYTYGRLEGIGFTYFLKDAMRINAMFIDDEDTEYGFSGRLDYKVMGEWAQLNDFSSWSGEGQSLAFGIAGSYQEDSHGEGNGYGGLVYGVVDASFESNGLGLYAAVAASNDSGTFGHYETYGMLIQGNYMFVADKFEGFARYEYINRTTGGVDLNVITFGANYYLAGHNAKFTVDVQYAPTNVGTVQTPGLMTDVTTGNGNRNQTALRAQFQLLF